MRMAVIVMLVSGGMLASGQVVGRLMAGPNSATISAPVPNENGPSVEMPAPSLPYLDWKACPFEGCAYKEWTAQRQVVVYDTWEEKRRPVGQLENGVIVKAITGVVITSRPGVVRMDRDLPARGLKTGDQILTYTDLGEGFSAVWLKGRFYSEFEISIAKLPDGTGCGGAHCAATYVNLGEKKWWAQVELKSGAKGWVNMDHVGDDFKGTSLLWDGN
jgi:hypothetical protein